MSVNTARKLSVDDRGFFYQLGNCRIEVRFHSDHGYITPDTPRDKYPDWLKQRLGVKG